MRFIIQEKFWAFGDEYTIFDADGRPRFYVVGQAFSWNDPLYFLDADRNEVGWIEQRRPALRPTYSIFRDGKKFAEVVKEFSWISKDFTLNVPGPNDYTVKGRFWQHEYAFERSGAQVAVVSMEGIPGDSYVVDVIDGEDEVAILCTVIVIDQILEDAMDAEE